MITPLRFWGFEITAGAAPETKEGAPVDPTEKKLVICFFATFAALNLLGYLAGIDALKTFVAAPGSRSIHFVSLAVSVAAAAVYSLVLAHGEQTAQKKDRNQKK